MIRTTFLLATVAVAVSLSLESAQAQYQGPAGSLPGYAEGGIMPAVPVYPAPVDPYAVPPGYPVQPAGLLLGDGGCDGGCGGGCDACGGMSRGTCDGGCNGGCDSCSGRRCGLLGRYSPFCSYWGSIEYMLMWGKGRYSPPLATTSPTGTPRAQAGVLGFPDTDVLFGGPSLGNDESNGMRVVLGGWLDPYESVGLGVRLTAIDGDSPSFGDSSFGRPILAVPFYDVWQGQENSNLASFPNEIEGTLNVDSELDMWAVDTYLRAMVARGCGYRVDVLGGYQYTRIDDGITIHSVATSLPGNTSPGVVPGTVFDTWDSFDTRNSFNGGTVGLHSEFYFGRMTLAAMGKIGFGNMRHRVTIQGREIRSVPGQDPFRRNGGLLTQNSNIGVYETDETAFVPEATLSLAYNLNCNLKVTFGYNFIYWTRVVLAGDQIDRNVDPLQILGLPGDQPAFLGFRDTDFWLMGGSVGIEGKF
ncbi:MAG: BBP7 family outer membrane beta-barrel protein [Pirellulaceae bacterium]|nr:BBP7 family outer membrane beta-barrel protein [Pirellulaceae bacterium]